MTIIKVKVLIIGSGPGSLSAAIYCARGLVQEKSVYCLVGPLPGGQLTTTEKVYNYVGHREIDGMELMENIIEQSKDGGTTLEHQWAQTIEVGKTIHRVYTESKIYESPVIIIGTGANHKKLPVKKEEVFKNKGIYYCATCDGPLFKNEEVVVVGGGNTALTEAIFLSSICKTVNLIHRRDKFSGEPFLIKNVKNKKNIQIFYFYEIKKLNGNQSLEKIILENNQNKEQKIIKTKAVFVAIGFEPNISLIKNTNISTEDGYILTNNKMETNIPGIYAIGDVTDKIYRQAITAAGDGAKAGINGLKYLEENQL